MACFFNKYITIHIFCSFKIENQKRFETVAIKQTEYIDISKTRKELEKLYKSKKVKDIRILSIKCFFENKFKYFLKKFKIRKNEKII